MDDDNKKETITVPVAGHYSTVVQPTVISNVRPFRHNTSLGVSPSWFAVATKRNLTQLKNEPSVNENGGTDKLTHNCESSLARKSSLNSTSDDHSTRKRKLNSIVEKIGNKQKESNIVGIPISIG